MITITKNGEHDYTTACQGADGCGETWDGLYSELTANDVASTHFHGPHRTYVLVSPGHTNYAPTMYGHGAPRRFPPRYRIA